MSFPSDLGDHRINCSVDIVDCMYSVTADLSSSSVAGDKGYTVDDGM